MKIQGDRLIIRSFYVTALTAVSFGSAILIQQTNYWWAALLALVGISLALLEVFQIPRPRKILCDQYTLDSRIVDKILGPETVQTIENKLNQFYGQAGFPADWQVLLTAHLAIRSFHGLGIHSDWVLVQLTNYVGPHPRGKNRIISAHKGIVGRTFRSQRPQIVNFENENDYFTRMTEEFSFFANEANYHSTDARSYFAVPFGAEAGELPYGILYAHARISGVFKGEPTKALTIDYQDICTEIANALAADTKVLNARSR